MLYRFYRRCAEADLPELQRLATTVETWWPEILAFLHTGITNAGPEGTNRVIKTIARDAYGFRNPGNQRLRTRCATNPSSPWTPRCPLISLSLHPAIVLASGTELSVPQVSAWL
ncbi:transposase [Streptomyces rhizosphaerihabitans]|uniref:transposase n=1 Tax=Streptomyces rhizosphaerihabitans TaxID=1266770 RepID=UPI0037043554